MKKVSVLVVVLMFAVAAWAYQGSYGSSTKATSSSKTSTASTTKSTAKSTSKSTASAAAKESTMTGCLSGPDADGDFLLKNGNHRKGVEVTGDLKGHVGHKVKLTGTWVTESAEAEAKEAKGEKGEKGEEAGEKQFKVSKVDMIADTCTVPEAAKKSSTSKTMTKTK